jgi:broad specificity phosphatase PhoE
MTEPMPAQPRAMSDTPDLKPGLRASGKPTLVYMIRHAEPEEQYLNVYYGQQDVPLGERGREQSRQCARRLVGVPFDAVYASDLSRAVYLAEQLAEPLDLPVRRLAVFRERHMGILQGHDLPTLETRYADLFGQWRANRIHFRVPEAENFPDLRDRVIPALAELVAAFAGRRVALVCHAGPIRVALAHAMGLELDHIFRLGVNHCAINVLEVPAQGPPRVTLLNG